MSEIRVALVAEGPTDRVVIEAGLRAALPRSFVLTLLQPEATRSSAGPGWGATGTGWGGVFKWCTSFRQRGAPSVDLDATLSLFDLVIFHLDADVADKSYADCGPEVVAAAVELPPLPCALPCPPPIQTVQAMETLLLGWLGIPQIGNKGVLCIPSKSSETWLTAALFPDRQHLVDGLECRFDLEVQLAQLPKLDRIRKNERQYSVRAPAVTQHWQRVVQMCSQAARFDAALKQWTVACNP